MKKKTRQARFEDKQISDEVITLKAAVLNASLSPERSSQPKDLQQDLLELKNALSKSNEKNRLLSGSPRKTPEIKPQIIEEEEVVV